MPAAAAPSSARSAQESIWRLRPGQVIDEINSLVELDEAVHYVATTRIWGRPLRQIPSVSPRSQANTTRPFRYWHPRSLPPSMFLGRQKRFQGAESLQFGLLGLPDELLDDDEVAAPIYAARMAIVATLHSTSSSSRRMLVGCDIRETCARGVLRAIVPRYASPTMEDRYLEYYDRAKLLGASGITLAQMPAYDPLFVESIGRSIC